MADAKAQWTAGSHVIARLWFLSTLCLLAVQHCKGCYGSNGEIMRDLTIYLCYCEPRAVSRLLLFSPAAES
jgi:hypothetical protein